jgi:hypothetical protein
MPVQNNFVSSSAATYAIENSVDLSFISSYQHQFATALEDAKSLYTVVSGTGTGISIAS